MPSKKLPPFQLRDEILKSHSVEMRRKVQEWVGEDQARFDSLLELVLNGGKVLEQRASWPLSFCVEQHPELASQAIGRLLENLKRPKIHGAVIRNTFRLLQFGEIFPEHEEAIFSAAMGALGGPVEVAVKAFSVTILRRLVDRFPEMREEILLLIREQLSGQSPAFRARVKNEFGLAAMDTF